MALATSIGITREQPGGCIIVNKCNKTRGYAIEVNVWNMVERNNQDTCGIDQVSELLPSVMKISKERRRGNEAIFRTQFLIPNQHVAFSDFWEGNKKIRRARKSQPTSAKRSIYDRPNFLFLFIRPPKTWQLWISLQHTSQYSHIYFLPYSETYDYHLEACESPHLGIQQFPACVAAYSSNLQKGMPSVNPQKTELLRNRNQNPTVYGLQ